MAFPTIPTSAAGRILSASQANTTAARTFPNLSSLTKNPGDLLIAIVVAYQTSTGTDAAFSGWGGGFTEFSDRATSTTMAIGMAHKWSDGTEAGTFTVTQAGTITGHAVMFLMSIPGAHASTPPEASAKANGTSSAPSTENFNPAGWDVEDTLWIAVCGVGETATGGSFTGVSGVPGGTTPTWTDLFGPGTLTADVVGGVEAAVAFGLRAQASVLHTGFSVDTSNARNSQMIVAVRPAAASPQTLDGAVFANPPVFEVATLTATFALTMPAAFTKPPAFEQGSATPGAFALTMPAVFTNPPGFEVGQVQQAQTLVGALFSNPPTFEQGALTVALTMPAVFAKPPSFGQGTITTTYLLSGAVFTNPPGFEQGALTATYQLAGQVMSKPPSFSQGLIVYVLAGQVFANPPAFEQGALTASYQLDGQVMSQPPAFEQGTIAVGAVTLEGQVFVKPPVFAIGEMIQAGVVSGEVFANPPVFETGSVSTIVAVLGQLFSRPPTFIVGTVTGEVVLVGALFSNPPTFIAGVISTGGITGVPFLKPPAFLLATIILQAAVIQIASVSLEQPVDPPTLNGARAGLDLSEVGSGVTFGG